jgi:nicotinate-nucleotide adenylyltransferase
MEQWASGGGRVAFFGGSFDPPHQGHFAVARAAQGALALDTVLFAPVGAQPLKPQGSTASFDDRVEMTRLAVAGEPGFAVSLADAPKNSSAPNYTLDTLLELRAGLAPGGELFCLMGADSFFGLRQWHRAAEIPLVASLIVASRPGQPLNDLKAALPLGLAIEEAAPPLAKEPVGSQPIEIRTWRLRNAAGQSAPFYLLPELHIEISASNIRELIHDGDSATEAILDSRQKLLPASVLDYIRARGLYR